MALFSAAWVEGELHGRRAAIKLAPGALAAAAPWLVEVELAAAAIANVLRSLVISEVARANCACRCVTCQAPPAFNTLFIVSLSVCHAECPHSSTLYPLLSLTFTQLNMPFEKSVKQSKGVPLCTICYLHKELMNHRFDRVD